MQIEAAVLTRVGLDRPWHLSRPIDVAAVELDAPGSGEVLVRIEAAGVCHSDLSRVAGDRTCAVPMVLGHEACGVVSAIGPGVVGVAVGQKVAMTFMPRCGECASCTAPGWSLCEPGSRSNAAGEMLAGGRRLRRGGSSLDHHGGVSGFASHAVVDQHSLVVIPDEIPSDVGALLGCAVLTGGGAIINAARLQPGEAVAVIGLGGVGLAAVLVAQAVGAAEVVGIDRLDTKLELARQFGVSKALTPEAATAENRRYSVVIDCVGNVGALRTAIDLTAPGGRTVTVGLPDPHAELTISPLTLVVEARSIIGSYMGSNIPEVDINRYVQLYQDGRLPIEKLISSHIRLADINKAMDDLDEGSVLRQVITFH